jgi:hypothetical protein
LGPPIPCILIPDSLHTYKRHLRPPELLELGAGLICGWNDEGLKFEIEAGSAEFNCWSRFDPIRTDPIVIVSFYSNNLVYRVSSV